MRAVDSNTLVYAHRKDSPFHDDAATAMNSLAESQAPWAIPWTCIHEFLGIATRPGIYQSPTTMHEAIDQVDSWLESPSLVLLTETPLYWSTLGRILIESGIVGATVHNARIAALCLSHGVSELITLDRDFSRFTALKTLSIPA